MGLIPNDHQTQESHTDLIWTRFHGFCPISDILDQGITLQALIDFCALRNPASVSSLVLVDKQCQRAVDIEADLVGIRAPDRYLFGCGMDYKGYWRNLPAIYAVAE